MSSLPSKAPKGLWAKVYDMVEKVMPWKYTGVYSHPEFKSHVPVAGHYRPNSPTNPPFKPITPDLPASKILEVKNFKEISSRAELLKDIELTPAQIAGMNAWQSETPLGGRRFRWPAARQHVHDYVDNGYR